MLINMCINFKILRMLVFLYQGIPRAEYEAKKQLVADQIISRLENKLFPGLRSSIDFMEVRAMTSYFFICCSNSILVQFGNLIKLKKKQRDSLYWPNVTIQMGVKRKSVWPGQETQPDLPGQH